MTSTLTRPEVGRATSAARPGRSRKGRGARGPLLILLGPFAVLFVIFFVAPIVYALVQSLFALRSSGLGFGPPTLEFVGVENYVRAFAEGGFAAGLARVLLIALIQVPLMVVGALVLALLLESGRAHWPRFFRVVFFMPYGVPGVIASLLWGFLYIPATSPVLQGLSALGVDLVPLSSDSVLLAIVNIGLWGFAGYNMLVLIAALQAIPAELYEAASIDGASWWHTVRSIQLPLLRPSIVLVTVFTIIGTLQLFVEPLVLRPLTNSINTDFSPNLAAYSEAFAQGNSNLAAAMAVIVAVLAFAISFGFLRLVNRKGERAW
ncbi:carbohydrate ABC transporter permease [Desertivibrio insolitus]|uniref:carbohydrate ABC transporter permease n=1 Tax=Herbiconiux sp. SYSU D00978 TaxID=2812562 RepID=UPI001A957E45|nr:sugar ABC transporter permease [Herbiconiux sp. SYSU D00978]